MTRLVWDKTGERLFEVGVDHGVLFPMKEDGSGYDKGVAWNGLTNVSESPEGAESNPQYADNIKYLNLVSAEEFKATIEAFTYPKEFEVCDGSATLAPGVTAGQQARRSFGFSYRTKIGNDTLGEEYGYKLHLVYGCTASPSEKEYETINDSPEAITFSWEVDSVPAECPGYRNMSTITIDSTTTDKNLLKAIEDMLYGEEGDPKLPMPSELLELAKVTPPFPKTKTAQVGTSKSEVEAAIKAATGKEVKDAGEHTLFIAVDEALPEGGCYFATVDAGGTEYGISCIADKSNVTVFYFDLTNGKQTDFVNKVKKASDAAGKLDLGTYTGPLTLTFYQTEERKATATETYPKTLTKVAEYNFDIKPKD